MGKKEEQRKAPCSVRPVGYAERKPDVPEPVLIERERAYSGQGWTLGMHLFGDPPPGRSALERGE